MNIKCYNEGHKWERICGPLIRGRRCVVCGECQQIGNYSF